MSALALDYKALLAETQPQVIHSEDQNAEFVAKLEALTSKSDVTDAEEKMIELLTVLVERFESAHYSLPEAGPLDIIRHLMEAHGLRQKDLTDVFGTESITSAVLNGKRELTRDHIRRLCARFGVPADVFF